MSNRQPARYQPENGITRAPFQLIALVYLKGQLCATWSAPEGFVRECRDCDGSVKGQVAGIRAVADWIERDYGDGHMSLNRYAKKRDLVEAPIIDALEKAGFEVWPLDEPCDLICRKASWAPGLFQALEVKTGRGRNLTIARDKRQETQINFLQTTGTPIVRTPFEALKAVGAIT